MLQDVELESGPNLLYLRPFLPYTTLVDNLTCPKLVGKCTEKIIYLSDKKLVKDI